jgi:hypothetical protein
MSGTGVPTSAAARTATTPGHGARRRNVDPPDHAVRNRAAQDRRVKLTLAHNVVDVTASPPE